MNIFTKPVDELTKADVEALWETELPEGQNVEFKSSLPSKKGGDPWLEAQQKVGDHAHDAILKEVVAFANSGGGNLVLGIDETHNHPKRAAGPKPLPKCHDLADRFRLKARDCIDPQLPSIEIAGVEIDGGAPGSGIVLFRVPSSRLAPHRLTATLECYVRRADRTEAMTMPEIHDRTFRSQNVFAEIEKRLNERRRWLTGRIENWRLRRPTRLGYRLTAMPTSGPIDIVKVYDRTDLFPNISEFVAIAEGANVRLSGPDKVFDINDRAVRPMMRGAWRETVRLDNMHLGTVRLKS